MSCSRKPSWFDSILACNWNSSDSLEREKEMNCSWRLFLLTKPTESLGNEGNDLRRDCASCWLLLIFRDRIIEVLMHSWEDNRWFYIAQRGCEVVFRNEVHDYHFHRNRNVFVIFIIHHCLNKIQRSYSWYGITDLPFFKVVESSPWSRQWWKSMISLNSSSFFVEQSWYDKLLRKAPTDCIVFVSWRYCSILSAGIVDIVLLRASSIIRIYSSINRNFVIFGKNNDV